MADDLEMRAKKLLAAEVSPRSRRHILSDTPSYAGPIAPRAALRAIVRALPTEQDLRETIAQEIEAWKPDASFDDSQIGAQQVRAVIQHCADIARRGRDYPGVAAVRRESE